jgi:hypothetical protein
MAPDHIRGDEPAEVIEPERGDADDSLPAGVADAVERMKAGAAKG